jgi:general secretion pathway protein L
VANPADAATFSAATLKLRHFWSWWSGELLGWVPLKLRPAAKFLNDSTFVQIEGKRIQTKRYREGRLQRLDELDLSALPLAEQPLLLRAWLSRAVPELDNLVLVLSPDNAISRRIELPRAAEENLRQAIGYELNRYTPFKASDVYFDYRVLKHVFGVRGLTVQIAVAPKTRVDPSLGLLAQAGVRPVAVVLGDDLSAERVPLNLLPLERRLKAAPRISAPNTLLAALALILFAAALGFPVWQKRQAIAAFNPLVESAKRDAEDVDRLKQDLDTQVQVYDFLLQRKHTYPAATIVMDELTRVLPDGTWLQQLNLRSHPKGWELQIQGETTISSRLASDIEDSPLFRDASFKSPLIKGQAPGSERFNLSAELEPAPAPKAQRLEDKRPPARAGAVRTVEQPAADTALQPATPLAPAKP